MLMSPSFIPCFLAFVLLNPYVNQTFLTVFLDTWKGLNMVCLIGIIDRVVYVLSIFSY